jgi:acetyl esterase
MTCVPIFLTMTALPPTAAASGIVESDVTIPMAGHPALAARIYAGRPSGATVPLVLHFHAGAFVAGDLDSGACMARLLAQVDSVVVSLAYPLAPAHPFPQAVEAGYAALEFMYKQRHKLAGKGAPVYLAGDEAGGNLAAAVALVARDRAHPPLAGQVLVAPMLDPCVGTASLRETMECSTARCKWADGWQQYLRSPMDAEHPYAVPAHAQRLVGLPPALILTGADDPMRDEALAYAQRLRQAGIPVTSELLQARTGWPDSLAELPPPESPCAAGVQRHLRGFFAATAPPPT